MHRVSTEAKNSFESQAKNLASIIRGFKSSVTMKARKIDPKFPNKVQTCYPGKAKIILGEEDTVIDPNTTKKMIKDMTLNSPQNIKTEIVEGMGHRIPLDIFITKTQHEF